ncbi:MAG: ABC transporter permease [Mariniblastus sp.]
MYKLLLSWRYLKTRFIALASIISVTLGVATLIVVNSVMAGFVDQMKSRLHGILSDIEVSAPILGEIKSPSQRIALIKNVIGDDLENITAVVRTPALLSFDFRGKPRTQQVMLLGIDDQTFGKVTDFEPFLTNEIKKTHFSFDLETDGYDKKFKPEEIGWRYRRARIERQRRQREWLEEQDRLYQETANSYFDNRGYRQNGIPDSQNVGSQPPLVPSFQDAQASYNARIQEEPQQNTPSANRAPESSQFTPLPDQVPDLDKVLASEANQKDAFGEKFGSAIDDGRGGKIHRFVPVDPQAKYNPMDEEELFDPAKSIHTGLILGIAISERKYIMADGSHKDGYMIKPGDDANIMLTTIGTSARPVMANCTVVDFYSSNMHEYDSSFAFVPLSELQQLRGMIDPMTGDGSVSTIQIKLKEGADLDLVRDKLIAQFPPQDYDFDIRTWQDTQRPLLAAVNMELTILNILLFLIIAVAGFGILATFYMIVVEKTKDIGILKALGAPSRGVMSIFLGYGMSLGSVGTGVGIILGLVFVNYINEIADWVGTITGQEIFDPTIYYFSEIPTIVNPLTVIWVGLGAIAIAVLASVLPALRAARLHPVEALRYE